MTDISASQLPKTSMRGCYPIFVILDTLSLSIDGSPHNDHMLFSASAIFPCAYWILFSADF
jgi:hypothetical protein